MANKSIAELPQAPIVGTTDLFVLQQSGAAKSLTGQVLINCLLNALDGHGGISSMVRTDTTGLVDTYTITYADQTTSTFTVTNGRGISNVAVSSGGTLTITFNDDTTYTASTSLKGPAGTSAYVYIKYSLNQPERDADLLDTPSNWMGVYAGTSPIVPTSYLSYTWYCIKGSQGPQGATGTPVTITSWLVSYQYSASGTSIPTGPWGTTVPAPQSGQFLWTRTNVSYSDGTNTVSYSVSFVGANGTGTGTVTSVNGVAPGGGTGNVTLLPDDIGAIAAPVAPEGGQVLTYDALLGAWVAQGVAGGTVNTVNGKSPDANGNVTVGITNISGLQGALDGKQDTLTVDAAPTVGSNNPVASGGTAAALAGKLNKSGGALTGPLTLGQIILTADSYGDTLPTAGVAGRLFFLKV